MPCSAAPSNPPPDRALRAAGFRWRLAGTLAPAAAGAELIALALDVAALLPDPNFTIRGAFRLAANVNCPVGLTFADGAETVLTRLAVDEADTAVVFVGAAAVATAA